MPIFRRRPAKSALMGRSGSTASARMADYLVSTCPLSTTISSSQTDRHPWYKMLAAGTAPVHRTRQQEPVAVLTSSHSGLQVATSLERGMEIFARLALPLWTRMPPLRSLFTRRESSGAGWVVA